MSDVARDHFVADFERRSSLLPGSATPSLALARRRALDQFATSGFPSPHEEEWKYTNVNPIAGHQFESPPRPGPGASAALVAALDFGSAAFEHLLVFLDGHFTPSLSRIGTLPGGATVANVAEVLAQNPARIEPYLGGSETAAPFTALNSAFVADGAFIHVPRGVVLDAPLHLLYLSTRADAVTQPRTIIAAEEGAQVTVLEHYSGTDRATYFTNAVTQVSVAPNASVEHYKLQQEGDAAFHVAAIQVQQQRDSRFASHSLALGGVLARTEIAVHLADTGCECVLNGLFLASGSQVLDHHTRVEHAHPHGTSREFYRGILDDQSRGVFAGRVIVHQGAQKTDAHLANHNLLLTPEAEVDTKPQLEIYADDVKCGHGTTVGQLSDDMLFYLRSRGIPKDLARALLTYAFAHDVIGRITLAPLRARVEDLLLARLPEGDLIREYT